MKRNIVIDLVGAVAVTILHVALFGFRGWGITAPYAVAFFAAFLVMDGIEWLWAAAGRPGDVKVIALLLLLAIGAGFPISAMLGLDHHTEISALIALLFAGLGIGGMIWVAFLSWRNHR